MSPGPCSKTVPCDNCPFRREGGIRTTVVRVSEIAATERAFPCHKTTVSNPEGRRVVTPASRMCAGFLIFNERRGAPNEAMLILSRLGLYDPARFRAPANRAVGSVFASLDEMLRVNRDPPAADRRGRRE